MSVSFTLHLFNILHRIYNLSRCGRWTVFGVSICFRSLFFTSLYISMSSTANGIKIEGISWDISLNLMHLLMRHDGICVRERDTRCYRAQRARATERLNYNSSRLHGVTDLTHLDRAAPISRVLRLCLSIEIKRDKNSISQ